MKINKWRPTPEEREEMSLKLEQMIKDSGMWNEFVAFCNKYGVDELVNRIVKMDSCKQYNKKSKC